jgi:hypothetical protein
MISATLQAKVEQLRKDANADRADAIKQLLDTRPDLNAKQRARLTEIGMEQGVAVLKDWLRDVVPPPQSPRGSVAPLGLEPPAMGVQGAGGVQAKVVRPSSNPKMNTLFRIMPGADSGHHDDGVSVNPTPGVLVSFSVFGAFAKVKALCKARVDEESRALARRKG